MELQQIIWFSFNVVFGFFSATNYLVHIKGYLYNRKSLQSTFGKITDMVVMTSILSYYLYY